MSEESQNLGEETVGDATPTQQETVQPEPDQTTEETKMVPLDALKSEREQRQGVQEELRLVKDHLTLIEANQRTQMNPPKKDDFDGLDDGDVMTFGDVKKVFGKAQQDYQASIAELKISNKHPDYQEVVTKYLPEVLRKNPSLRGTLEKTQDFGLAYHLSKNSDEFRNDNKNRKKSVNAQRIIENSAKAGSLSSMGSTTPISQAKRYKEMSTEEFKKLADKHLM